MIVMATDLEESDTEDHDRPGPAKKQRISPLSPLPVDISLASHEKTQQPLSEVEIINEEEEERRSREKLRGWQACQVAKGFVDNTINKVLEKYIMTPPSSYHFEDPWYHLFQGNQMEDTAVSMAIKNHGLVTTLDYAQSKTNLSSKREFNVPENSNLHLHESSSCTNSSNQVNWLVEKYDSDHQEDFLDRAVAEAIKKKGLSTLSVVDYG